MPDRKQGSMRIEVAPTARSFDLSTFATRVIERGSLIKTAGASTVRNLSQVGYEHQFFIGTGSAEPAHVNLPGVHTVVSVLNQWLTGTLHYALSQEHLGYHLND